MPLNAEPADRSAVRTLSVSEFRANCPTLFDEVRDTGEEIVITKHGHPVAKVGPVGGNRSGTLVGMAADLITLPPDCDVKAAEPFDPDWYDQWSAKWDARLAAEPPSAEPHEPGR